MIVCTWCGEKFDHKTQLLHHRLLNPSCNNNRLTNDPTQMKNMPFGTERIVPGERTLELVRENTDDD